MFMDLRMKEADYQSVPSSIREMMEIRVIDEVNPDYKEDLLWTQLKKESTKAYKKLKDREYELRNGAPIIPIEREEVDHGE